MRTLAAVWISVILPQLEAASPPQAQLDNGQVQVGLYLPDAQHGYYRGTRFDWSGMIHSLRYQGHEFYTVL